MKVDRIAIHSLKIPFSLDIRHHLGTRQQTESVVVVLRDNSGTVGYGEGTPRDYVTGETLEGCLNAAQDLARRVIGQAVASRNDLITFLTSLGDGDVATRHPAAYCAIETALLDLWSRLHRVPLYALMGGAATVDQLHFSGVIPYLTREETFLRLLALVKRLHLPALKLKVIDASVGIAQLKRIRTELGPAVDLRVDANGAFTPQTAIAFIREAGPINLSAVEQPVAKEDLDGLKAVSAASDIPVIADESMYTSQGAPFLIENAICHGLNIRLSSCGGIRKAAALYRRAAARKMVVVLGAHVGETAILSSAGRHLAMLCPAARYLEGSFSTYVLAADLVDGGFSFGRNGAAPAPKGPGLGITVDPAALSKWSVPHAVVNS